MAKITKVLVKRALDGIGIFDHEPEYIKEVIEALNPRVLDDGDYEDMTKAEADNEKANLIAMDLMEMSCDDRLWLTPWGTKRLDGIIPDEVREAQGM